MVKHVHNASENVNCNVNAEMYLAERHSVASVCLLLAFRMLQLMNFLTSGMSLFIQTGYIK